MAPKKLLDQTREILRTMHCSYRTEQTYVDWIRRFILYQGKRHPSEMGEVEIQAFLTHLANERNVAASTQNQALSAILFLYRHVLRKELVLQNDLIRAQQPGRLPTVLTKQEALAVIESIQGTPKLMAQQLLFGSELRLMECMRLRVKDIDFATRQVVVRDGKGENDRVTPLPASVMDVLREHLKKVKVIHERDLKEGFGEVSLPYELDRKYPSAPRAWVWQYVFPASQRSVDPISGQTCRHNLDETVLQRAVKEATRIAKIDKPVSPHTFRHSFATHLL